MLAMTRFYSGDLTKLSDSDLTAMQEEILNAGALMIDTADYDDEDWILQAHDRYWEIDKEQKRRWEMSNPEEAERQRLRRKPFSDMMTIAMNTYKQGALDRLAAKIRS